MGNNDNWAYVEMFGKVRYCRVTRTDSAKGLGKEYCFKKGEVCWIERQFSVAFDQNPDCLESWHGWHHYKNKVAVAVKRDDWLDFFVG